MLVALGGEVELVGALRDGLSSLSKRDSAMGGRLVGRLLAEEQETLASLGSPGSKSVVLEEGGDGLGVDGISTEPEVLLGVDEVPSIPLAFIVQISL